MIFDYQSESKRRQTEKNSRRLVKYSLMMGEQPHCYKEVNQRNIDNYVLRIKNSAKQNGPYLSHGTEKNLQQ